MNANLKSDKSSECSWQNESSFETDKAGLNIDIYLVRVAIN